MPILGITVLGSLVSILLAVTALFVVELLPFRGTTRDKVAEVVHIVVALSASVVSLSVAGMFLIGLLKGTL